MSETRTFDAMSLEEKRRMSMAMFEIRLANMSDEAAKETWLLDLIDMVTEARLPRDAPRRPISHYFLDARIHPKKAYIHVHPKMRTSTGPIGDVRGCTRTSTLSGPYIQNFDRMHQTTTNGRVCLCLGPRPHAPLI